MPDTTSDTPNGTTGPRRPRAPDPARDSPGGGSVAATYLSAAAVAVDLVRSEDVAAAWTRPSVLDGYSVGGLACHLARALLTVDAYLDAPPPGPRALVVDAPGYFVGVLGDHDPLTSDFHQAVRQRAEHGAADGHRALAGRIGAVLEGLAGRPLDEGQRIAVFGGTATTLGDYLRTRLVELTVHGVDLADSVGAPRPRFDASAWAVAARVVAEVALARNPAERITLALARADRCVPAPAF